MATLSSASASNKDKISSQAVRDLGADLGLKLPEKDVEGGGELIASVQNSIDITETVPDYVPLVDLARFPRKNVYRPNSCENPGNALAWKVNIEGEAEGSLKGLNFCLKDKIAVKDVPMLLGADVFTDYVPNIDAGYLPSILY